MLERDENLFEIVTDYKTSIVTGHAKHSKDHLFALIKKGIFCFFNSLPCLKTNKLWYKVQNLIIIVV